MPWKNESPEVQRSVLALKMLCGAVCVTTLCARFGVSRQTAYKWLRRFKSEGKKGLFSRQLGRPFSSGKWIATWRARVLAIRGRRMSQGAAKVRWQLGQKYRGERMPSVRTIHRWLKAAGKVPKRKRRLRAGSGISRRILPTAPNAVWTADFKGDFWTQDGQRVLPLTVRDLYSRYLLAVQPVRATSETVIKRVFERLFRQYGVPRAIRVDQGTPFCGAGPYGLTALSLWWTRLGIEVQFVSRRHRVDNNAHEQMHRILKAEAATPPSRTYAAQRRRLQRWRIIYNHARPHEGLGDLTPAECYKPRKRRMPQPARARYPAGWTTRRVRPHGWVKLDGSHRHIGRAFVGLLVGFKPVTSIYHVYYGQLFIGSLDPSIARSGLNPRPQAEGEGGG